MSTDAAGNLPQDLAADLDPNDVLFVIGNEGQSTSGGKGNITSGKAKNALNMCTDNPCELQLDLKKFKAMQGKLVTSPDVLNIGGTTDCCETKVIFVAFRNI